MQWNKVPKKGIFLRRYKRFFADVEIDGKVEVAHVANTGSLKSVIEEGREALLWPSDNPERKLKWSLFALRAPDGNGWMGIDTALPNKIVEETFLEKRNTDWLQFNRFEREKKVDSKTRLDGLFWKDNKPVRYLEIKNVSLRENDRVLFPDAVTERGLKHIETLVKLMKDGFEAELCFVIQRLDCKSFAPAWEIDPDYSIALEKASKQGLVIHAWTVKISEAAAEWTGQELPIHWAK